MSYRSFMAEVNSILTHKFGVDSNDLADWLWRDAYDDGFTPEEAVRNFLETGDHDIPHDLLI